jgi:hypothetical protein
VRSLDGCIEISGDPSRPQIRLPPKEVAILFVDSPSVTV